MRHLLAATTLCLLLPALGRAQEAPEQLLSGKTQVYLRWDGIEAHRAAYSKTALGKMMQGDTGTFIQGVFTQIQEGIGTLLTVEQLLGGVPPEKLQQMQADGAEAAKVLSVIGQTGFILAAEVRSLEPPQGELTLVLPNAGDRSKPLFSLVRLVSNLARAEVKEHKINDRTVYHLEVPEGVPVHLSWWLEGKHAVVNLSTDAPKDLVKRWVAGNHIRLVNNPLFKRLHEFKDFETSARAFVDAAALIKLAETRGPEVKKLIGELGIGSLKNLVFYSGFAGEAERGLVELEMPGDRKGLLSLFKGKPFQLSDVPPLPPDVVSWSMTSIDPGQLYDVSFQSVEAVLRVVYPDAVPFIKPAGAAANTAIGVDIRNDLLGALDDRFVQYSAPSEGPFTLGQVFMFKVKDKEKLKDAMEQLVKGIARLTNGEVIMKKRTYKGVELREVRFKQQGLFFVPTYCIHKDWLCIALFPQPVHGFILRSEGALPAWKPSPTVQAGLDQLPKTVVSISYGDPRPSVKTLLSIAPMIGGLVNSLVPESTFEVGSIPTAQEATHHLFPNLSVATVDEKGVRIESRASLPLPVDVVGVDSYALVFFLFQAVRFGF
jgi:hypothetical protein